MISKIWVTVISLLCISSSFALSLSDYVFPNTKYQELLLYSSTDLKGEATDTTRVIYNLSGDARFLRDYRTLRCTYRFLTEHNLQLQRNDDYSYHRNATVYSTTDVSVNYYRSETSNFFGSLRGQFNYGYGRQKAHILDVSGHVVDSTLKTTSRFIDIASGLGYGRVFDATSLRKAFRISKRLTEFGILSHELTDSSLIALAHVIDRQSEYFQNYSGGYYKEYWYEAIEQVLSHSGFLMNNRLGSGGYRLINEVFKGFSYQRLHGWQTRGEYGVEVYRDDIRKYKYDKPYVGVKFEYDRPLTMTLQSNNILSMQYYKTRSSHDFSYLLRGSCSIGWELSEHVLWQNTLSTFIVRPEYVDDIIIGNWGRGFSRLSTEEENILRTATQKAVDLEMLQSKFSYYIANHITFTQTVEFSKQSGPKHPVNWRVLSNIGFRVF